MCLIKIAKLLFELSLVYDFAPSWKPLACEYELSILD
jgi:hypothetical protein